MPQVKIAGYDLSSYSDYADACAAYLADPSGFASLAAGKVRPIGGNEIMPTAADVKEWARIAC